MSAARASRCSEYFFGAVLVVIFIGVPVVFVACWVGSAFSAKHFAAVSIETNPTKGHKPGLGVAFAVVKDFLDVFAHANVDQDRHFSSTPLWDDHCQSDSTGVRVVAAVVNAQTGEARDATMLFCVDPQWDISAANPEARYLTTLGAGLGH